MGAAAATAVIATGSLLFQAAGAGMAAKAGREQDRLQKAALNRQEKEAERLIIFREGQRQNALASVIGTQQAALTGGNIVGGKTAELLELSATLDAEMDRVIDQNATAEQLLTLSARGDSINRARDAREQQLILSSAGALFDTALTIGQAEQAALESKPPSSDTAAVAGSQSIEK